MAGFACTAHVGKAELRYFTLDVKAHGIRGRLLSQRIVVEKHSSHLRCSRLEFQTMNDLSNSFLLKLCAISDELHWHSPWLAGIEIGR